MTKFFKITILIGFFFVSQLSLARNATVDSIYESLKQTTVDTVKVDLYLQLANHYQNNELDSFYNYAQQSFDLAEKIGWKKGIVGGAHKLSVYYTTIGQQDKVLWCSLKIMENDPDPLTYIVSAQTVSAIYLSNKQYEKAFEYSQKIIDNEKLPDDYKAFGFATKADIFRVKNELDSARFYFETAIELLEDTKTEMGISFKINSLMQYSVMQKDPNQAYMINLEIKELYKKILPNPRLHSIIQHSYASSILRLLEENENIDASIGKSKKELYAELEEILFSMDELTQNPEYEFLKMETADKLHRFYSLKKDYEKAYSWMLKYHDIVNELFSQESKNELAAIENEKLTERYEHEAEIKQLELDSKRKRLNLYIIVIVLSVIMLLLMTYYSINKRNTNKKLAKLNQDLTEANETKIRLFGIINHDFRRPIIRLISYLKFKKEIPESLSEEDRVQIEQETLEMSENILQLMEELLVWSKSQMEQFVPFMKKVSLYSLFEEVKQQSETNIPMEVNITEDVELYTDPYYIKTIIRNLSTNAIQAAQADPNPSVKWDITFDQSKIYLRITNNGKAMNEKQKNILLGGATPDNISHGLGLQIIHDLVKDISGEITIDHAKQAETAITLILNRKTER